MTFDSQKPFNDLPPLPPNGVDIESKVILKQAIAAHRSLAELKGAVDLIPNQRLLVQVIGLQEAKLSSEIENIVTTNDALYRAFADNSETADPQTKEVLSYNRALWHGYQRISDDRPFGTRLWEEIVQVIKGNTATVRRNTGTVIASSRGQVIYTPPEGEAVIRGKLADLETFLHRHDDVDPLIKMALLHYQFEAIHPFPDGNGRAGRILNILYLIVAGLLDLPVLYLSRYIIRHKSDYYNGLRGVSEARAWEPWIQFMLRATEVTASETCRQINDIRALMQETAEAVRLAAPRIYSKDLIEALFEQPYCRIAFLERAGIGHRQTVSKYLQELADLGVVERVDIGREAYFINHALLKLLTREQTEPTPAQATVTTTIAGDS